MKNKLRIVFSGMMAGDPHQGGATWAVLQYVLGLRKLGHEVLFVEPIAARSLRPIGVALAQSENAAYFRQVCDEFGLWDRAALLSEDRGETFGLTYAECVRFASSADLLINVSGMLTDPRLLEGIPTRVYLDLDPAFIQLWRASQGVDMRFDGHTHFVTIGLRIGQPGCAIPTCGREWQSTLQPIVLDEWPMVDAAPTHGWTTIANWRGYGSVSHDGVFYGQKAHAWRPLMALPRRVNEPFQPALTIHPDEKSDVEALAAGGWQPFVAAEVAGTPSDYRRFIQMSKGELAIAKSGYAVAQCGWFSDRSVCYLASGRPVIALDTAFSPPLPLGEGLFRFNNVFEAADAVEAASGDYRRHARGAREIAEAFFASDRVLNRLLDQVSGVACG